MNILTIIMVFFLIFSVVLGTNYYITRKLFNILRIFFPTISKKVFVGIFILLVLLLVLVFAKSMIPLTGPVKHILSIISSYWLGIFIYLFIFFLLTDIVVFSGTLFKCIAKPLSANCRLIAGIIAIALTCITSCYGFIHALQIKNVTYDITLTNKQIESDINIVMVSDLHLGAVSSEKKLPEIIRRINSLNPDLVCIAGDLFDSDFKAINNPGKCIDLFKAINAPYGVWACLGNHDAGATYSDMLTFAEQADINVLTESHTIIDNRLVLAGRLDASPIGKYSDTKRLDTDLFIKNIDSSLPVIVMDHNPAHIDTYNNNVDLILCGHTHQGQIFPGSLFTDNMFTVDYGYYQKNQQSPHVIVSSGVGTWGMPMRVGTDCEIVNIHIK